MLDQVEAEMQAVAELMGTDYSCLPYRRSYRLVSIALLYRYRYPCSHHSTYPLLGLKNLQEAFETVYLLTCLPVQTSYRCPKEVCLIRLLVQR